MLRCCSTTNRIITGNPYGVGRETAALFAREGRKSSASTIAARLGFERGSADEARSSSPTLRFQAVAAVVAECGRASDASTSLQSRRPSDEAFFEATTEETWNNDQPQSTAASSLAAVSSVDEEEPCGPLSSRIDRWLSRQPVIAAYSAGRAASFRPTSWRTISASTAYA